MARMFKDDITLNKIMSATFPGEMNALGARTKDFIKDIWFKSAPEISNMCHNAKFSQNPVLAKCLLDTGDNILLEASPYDDMWGIGASLFDPNLMNKKSQWGDNIQGKSLMKTRSSIHDAAGGSLHP